MLPIPSVQGATNASFTLGNKTNRWDRLMVSDVNCRCVGVEYNEDLVKRALTRVEERGVKELVDIRHGDALEVDLTTATAMFLYLVPQVRKEFSKR